MYSLFVSSPLSAEVKSKVFDKVVVVCAEVKSAFDHSTVYEVMGANPLAMSEESSFQAREI